MTPIMQNGYDAQRAGTLDADLMAQDTAAGREYREGTRRARREQADADAGFAPFVAPVRTADFLEPAAPPPVAVPEQAPEVASSHTLACGAFSEPEPKAKKPKKEKVKAPDQGDLFA